MRNFGDHPRSLRKARGPRRVHVGERSCRNATTTVACTLGNELVLRAFRAHRRLGVSLARAPCPGQDLK